MKTCRTCRTCNEEKPITQFYKNKNTYRLDCKSCHLTHKEKLKLRSSEEIKKRKQHIVPETTIFSINPMTNKPYISPEDATRIIYKHIRTTGKNLMLKNEVDDMKQSTLVYLCASNYDPTKSAPSTFIIMVTTSVLGRLYDYGKNKGRHLEMSDFTLGHKEDSPLYTEMAVDDMTPYDVLAANELIKEFNLNPPLDKARKPKRFPKGWLGYRK